MGWAFVYMFVILKIPVAAAIWLVWWASREPEAAPESGGGGGGGGRRDHPRPRPPRPPRRGPHAEPAPRAPSRIRVYARRPDRTHSS